MRVGFYGTGVHCNGRIAKTSGPTPSGCEQQQCPAKPGQDHCAPEPSILAHVRPKHPMAMVANGHEQERENAYEEQQGRTGFHK